MRIIRISLIRTFGPALLFVALLWMGLALAGNANKSSTRVTWQSSTSAHVRVGVRDKLGQLGKYSAEFTVTTPSGQQFKRTRQVQNSDWSYVFFPGDFNAWWEQGRRYAWECRVGGKIAAEGVFEHEYLKPPGKGERVVISTD